MTVGDLVQIRNQTMLASKSVRYGLIFNYWIINGEYWFRVLWDNGKASSVVSHDLELINE